MVQEVTGESTRGDWVLGDRIWFANYADHGGNRDNHYAKGDLSNVAVYAESLPASFFAEHYDKHRPVAELYESLENFPVGSKTA